jgi:predicted dehydrogenase
MSASAPAISEARSVIEAAQNADRLLEVDLSYRHTAATRAIAELIRSGDLGRIFSADLTFHNAYGPDKPWFYRREESGGGCVMDLGVHMVDLALWLLDFPAVESVASRLYSLGGRLEIGTPRSRIMRTLRIDLEGDVSMRLACSWNLNAGREAAIEATFYGTQGAAGFRNVSGSLRLRGFREPRHETRASLPPARRVGRTGRLRLGPPTGEESWFRSRSPAAGRSLRRARQNLRLRLI